MTCCMLQQNQNFRTNSALRDPFSLRYSKSIPVNIGILTTSSFLLDFLWEEGEFSLRLLRWRIGRTWLVVLIVISLSGSLAWRRIDRCSRADKFPCRADEESPPEGLVEHSEKVTTLPVALVVVEIVLERALSASLEEEYVLTTLLASRFLKSPGGVSRFLSSSLIVRKAHS